MTEGGFVQHFITCEKLSQVDEITNIQSSVELIMNKSINSYVKMIKIKVIPTQNYMYVTYVSTTLKFCLYCRDAYLSN